MRVIACSMIEDEVLLAMQKQGVSFPVVWLEKQLHDSPERLRAATQCEIEKMPAGETVLLALCQCGNGTVGLASGSVTLVLPKKADCTHMLSQDGKDHSANCLYYTRGWIHSDGFLTREYQCAVDRLGPNVAKRAYRSMLKNYRAIKLIDTGAYDVQEVYGEALAAAELFGLELEVLKGGVDVLCGLFSKQWDDGFIVLPPGGTITHDMFASHSKR